MGRPRIYLTSRRGLAIEIKIWGMGRPRMKTLFIAEAWDFRWRLFSEWVEVVVRGESSSILESRFTIRQARAREVGEGRQSTADSSGLTSRSSCCATCRRVDKMMEEMAEFYSSQSWSGQTGLLEMI
ncbi:unnamed protein product [Linum trigynum]|uniref:Uncharacterized protein n=1 Tax=Linum trigynum TaxID=586398 RepID=A0AAV2E9C5_9ROSI